MPNYTERTVLSKPRDFDQVANNAGSGGVVNNNLQWDAFVEMLDNEIDSQHKKLE